MAHGAKAAVLAALVLAVLALGLHWQWVMVHVSQGTGTSNSASRAYDFWSGFGSDIGEVALVGGIVTLVRHHNCHSKGCWRLGKHSTPEGYRLCRHCVAKPKSELDLHPIHPDHAQ